MRGLLGDRFLRKFAGDLKHLQKNQNSTGEGINPEAEEALAPGPEAVSLDRHASEEECEEAGAAGAHLNNVPTIVEPNKQHEGGPKAD